MMTHTKALWDRVGTPFTGLVLVSAFLYFVPSFLMDKIWYDIRSITISHQDNGELQAEFDRTIKRDFTGTYRITVRDRDGSILCIYNPEQLNQFEKDADLPQPLLLSHIFQGKENLQPCINNGFDEGTFYMDICQSVRLTPFDLVAARQCFRTNEFTVENVDQIT